MTFFTSDPHYFHTNISRYCGRPFNSIDEMNATLIDKWCARVMEDDTVWVLGDMSLSKIEALREIMECLPGHKNLVMGNHDRLNTSKYVSAGFERVVHFNKDYSAYVDLQMDGMKIRLCHYPGWLETEKHDTYFDHCLFGHIHQKDHNLGPKFHNLSVERTDYSPVTLEEALKL